MAPIPNDPTMDRILKGRILKVQNLCTLRRIHPPHSHQCIHRLHIHRLRIALPRHQQKKTKTFLLTIQRHSVLTSDVVQVLGRLPPHPHHRPLHHHLLLNTTNNSLCLT